MLDKLTEKVSASLKKLRNQTFINEKNMDDTLQEIRIALIESDVNLKVVKMFINNCKDKLIGKKIHKKLDASQEIISVFNDELVKILDNKNHDISLKSNPAFMMMVGLQGSGKTTTSAKLANYIKNKNLKKKILLVACDIYRPGAIEQLEKLGKSINIDVLNMGTNINPRDIAKEAYRKGHYENYDLVILDTAGRLHIDKDLMEELRDIKKIIKPSETLMVIDSMSGQDLVNVAETFNNEIKLTGTIITKLDSDTRGGASLSLSYLLKLPIKFIGIGENINNLDVFYPKRIASRILGMGDIVSFVEKIKSKTDDDQIEKMSKRIQRGLFDMTDLLAQMKQIKKMGSMTKLLKLLPQAKSMGQINDNDIKERLKISEAIISSMTIQERRNPKLLKDSSRKNRIIKGSGRTPQEFNQLIKRFEQSKVMMKKMKGANKFSSFGNGFPGNFNF